MQILDKDGKSQLFARKIVSRACSPIDRLGLLLLNWKPLQDSQIQIQNSEKSHIPETFESVDEYIAAFEPYLIDELKAAVMSNFSSNNKIVGGNLNFCTSRDSDATLLTINCSIKSSNSIR